jgi:hypothetical protein
LARSAIQGGQLQLVVAVVELRRGRLELRRRDERRLELSDQSLERWHEPRPTGRAPQQAKRGGGRRRPQQRQPLRCGERRRQAQPGGARCVLEERAEGANREPQHGASRLTQLALESSRVVTRRDDEDGVALQAGFEALAHLHRAAGVRGPDDHRDGHSLSA